jgi:hypothetical protein
MVFLLFCAKYLFYCFRAHADRRQTLSTFCSASLTDSASVSALSRQSTTGIRVVTSLVLPGHISEHTSRDVDAMRTKAAIERAVVEVLALAGLPGGSTEGAPPLRVVQKEAED